VHTVETRRSDRRICRRDTRRGGPPAGGGGSGLHPPGPREAQLLPRPPPPGGRPGGGRDRDRETWKRWHERRHHRYQQQFGADFTEETAEGLIDSVTIFGGTKKVIISKDFQGGSAVTVFGGAEINLTQADIQGRAVLDLVQIFGGAKLVVPANWRIQADEMVSIFGGLDDKRNPATLNPDDNKVLILKGTSIFGGIDIKSY
ncbi:hypothetical protein KK078_24530, partial [Fulvivirgaceae bacterium PWU37]|nr:hypothetical protein [Dawidia soli]